MEHERAHDRELRRLQRAERWLAVVHRAAMTALALASLWLLLR